MGKARPKATTIPYYHIRDAVERGYGRRRMLWQSVLWGVVTGVGGTLWYVFSRPSPVVFVAVGIAVVLTLAVLIAMFLVQLVGDTLSLSAKEEELVETCMRELAPWADDAPTRAAIREMADRPGDGIQVRSLLAIVILTVVSTVAVAVDLPLLAALLMGELALLALISVVVVIGQAHADIVIRNALIELERRQAVAKVVNVQEAAPAASPALPLSSPPSSAPIAAQPTPPAPVLAPRQPAHPVTRSMPVATPSAQPLPAPTPTPLAPQAVVAIPTTEPAT